jgi:hypothetical protein
VMVRSNSSDRQHSCSRQGDGDSVTQRIIRSYLVFNPVLCRKCSENTQATDARVDYGSGRTLTIGLILRRLRVRTSHP